MELSLKGKRAVICGSSQGIGRAVAHELALLGATCVLLARNAASLEEAVAGLPTDFGQQHAFAVADFSKPAEVSAAITALVAEGPVHILINNTGGPPSGPITDAREEDFLQAFQQHLVNNHHLVQAVVPGMKAAGFGRIINIISTSVKVPLPNLGVSNTIRAAVASWAKTMANELGQYQITVNNVLPGYTETQRLTSLLSQTARKKGEAEEKTAADMVAGIPARRFGTATEVAAVVAFLASPAAAYVNGTSIRVDGGRTGSI
ncbi:SDR family oxidoreductase [Paraflavisolibacter sp. H34]|uniref:SDR family oxidoreductase n=1 Tax=Huijunlia imazamoxiresistens TaxID=3127457 RepID=UPI003017345A